MLVQQLHQATYWASRSSGRGPPHILVSPENAAKAAVAGGFRETEATQAWVDLLLKTLETLPAYPED
jgi:hypothetical protein